MPYQVWVYITFGSGRRNQRPKICLNEETPTYSMRTATSLLIAYLFGDKVNPIYIFIGMYALSGVGIYFFWKWKKKSKTK